jgi:hypothetical protein
LERRTPWNSYDEGEKMVESPPLPWKPSTWCVSIT